MIIPTVKMSAGIYADIFSALLEQRIVLLQGEITDDLALTVNAQLLYLASQSADPIELYIDSPGGSVSAGLSIIDMMHRIKPDVYTIVSGSAASMGAVIFSAGAPGKRFLFPHAECMIHSPSSGFEGNVSDFQNMADHMVRTKNVLVDLLSQYCQQPQEKISKDIERSDYWLSASEAVEYGLADKIIED